MNPRTLHKKEIKEFKSFLNSQLDLATKIVITEKLTSIGQYLHLEITLKDKSVHHLEVSDISSW